MKATRRLSISLQIPWRTILRLLVAALLVWCLLRLTTFFFFALIAILLAVTLDPVICRLEGYRLPRWLASSLVMAVLIGSGLGFVYFASTGLSQQAQLVGGRLGDLKSLVVSHVPFLDNSSVGRAEQSLQSYLEATSLVLLGSLARALTLFALATILTLYLLIEGRRTYAWMLAFVPEDRREKVALTAAECQRVMFGYVAGNLATSAFATIFVFVTLTALHVPAALLLALLAGVCDFVPVLGFACSAIPAILLGSAVSPSVGLMVLALYVGYHTVENYFIAPFVYGDGLRLSNVAVVVAFAVGAELAGVAGALIALPIAAAYPAVERIWFRKQLGIDVVLQHSVIERRLDVSPAEGAASASAPSR